MKKNAKMILSVAIVLVLMSVALMTACSKCEHDFQKGVCVDCGEIDPDYKEPTCTHSYTNGTCTKCGTVCTHSYKDGACQTCGVACTHNYEDGVCETCGAACSHSYTNSICETCGAACTHSYTDGTCTACGSICTHTFTEGVCSECGVACAHTYQKGACLVCGVKDPDWPTDGGRSLYNEIVAKYKYLVLFKSQKTELPPRGDSEDEPFYMDALYEVVGHYDPAKNFGYSYKDINDDGYDELFLIENTNRLYAMFTVKEKAPVLVTTFQSGMGYLQNNGTVFFNTKNGYKFLGNHITRLVDGKLVGIVYGWEDPDDDISNSNDIYYYISEDGTRAELTKEDYDVIKNEYIYYWENPTRLTKLSNLVFNPALIATGTPTIKAAFSTYDAIIKTFGNMHSLAVEGKWNRSKWIGGAYDEGMIFRSEADFVLYNKLFAAYFLVTKEKIATVGSAKKDLNGDGVEELILLDGNFNIFAIFTQVDGEVVLLDSYNDLRTAFIDADGLIHVKERIIPGYYKDSKNDGIKCDYEAFVYEIRDGKLVEKIAIGIKFDAKGDQEKIYKLSGGTALDIEQSEWDALYADFTLDLGEATFAAYTKEKSGLVFVEALLV